MYSFAGRNMLRDKSSHRLGKWFSSCISSAAGGYISIIFHEVYLF